MQPTIVRNGYSHGDKYISNEDFEQLLENMQDSSENTATRMMQYLKFKDSLGKRSVLDQFILIHD